MDRKTMQSVKNYDEIAENYDETFDGRYTASFKKELYQTVRLEDGNRILDVACGNGTLLKLLSCKAAIEGYGVDISENMVKEAQKRYPGFHFAVSNSSSLPFGDGVFDAVTVSAAFHHFSEPRQFISEARRVLKPGGRVYIADPYFPPVVRQLANLVIPFFRMGDVKVYNKAELVRFLDGRGFKNIDVRRFGKSGYIMCGERE